MIDESLLNQWTEWARRDDWHRRFVGSDIRQMLGEIRRRGVAPIPDREIIARAIYEIEPHYESGEYVDGFQVSPGGNLSWEQAKSRDAEFGDDPLFGKITEYAYRTADAVIACLTSA